MPTKITQEKLLVMRGFDIQKIFQNLSNHNPDIIVDSDGKIKRYILKERAGKSIPLSVLPMALNHTFKRDPEFQRESDDHKRKTPQQIVSDYLCGQFMGYISCYVDENQSGPKLVIDGKHRLTHLEKFLKGELILRDKEASQFWNHHVGFLIKNFSGNTIVNKILLALSNTKNIPPVNYQNLPDLFKHHITSNVNIDVYDITVECKDQNDKIVEPDLKRVEEMYYRKFLRINQNSANMKPEDIIWGCGSEYNATSRSMSKEMIFDKLFNISNNNPLQKRKFNEMLFSILLMLDNRTNWGSGGKSFVSKINTPEYFDKKTNGESIKFTDIWNSIIIPNFTKFFNMGNYINIPDNLKGIESKGTNIKYMIYFLYKIHQMALDGKIDIKLYEDRLPTIILQNIIEIGALIISCSTMKKDGTFLQHPKLYRLQVDHYYLFEKLNDYRTRQRSKDKEIDPLFEKLVEVCIENLKFM